MLYKRVGRFKDTCLWRFYFLNPNETPQFKNFKWMLHNPIHRAILINNDQIVMLKPKSCFIRGIIIHTTGIRNYRCIFNNGPNLYRHMSRDDIDKYSVVINGTDVFLNKLKIKFRKNPTVLKSIESYANAIAEHVNEPGDNSRRDIVRLIEQVFKMVEKKL